MNKDRDYTAIFSIIGSKGKFAECYQARRYLPPLQHIEPEERQPQYIEHIHHNVNDTRRVFAKLNSMDRVVKYLLGKELEKQKGGKKSSPYFLKKVSNIRGEEGGG